MNSRVRILDNVSVEDMTNYFKQAAGEAEFTGLNLILGSYSIHLLECENVIMNKILRSLLEYMNMPNTPYHEIWVIH